MISQEQDERFEAFWRSLNANKDLIPIKEIAKLAYMKGDLDRLAIEIVRFS